MKYIFLCALVATQTLLGTEQNFLIGEEATMIDHYHDFAGITEENYSHRITLDAIGKKISLLETVAWICKNVYSVTPPPKFGRKKILDQHDLLYNTSPCKSSPLKFRAVKQNHIDMLQEDVNESPLINQQTGEKKFGIFDHLVLSLKDQGYPIPSHFKHTELFGSDALYKKENGKTYYKISGTSLNQECLNQEPSHQDASGKTRAVKAVRKSVKYKKP